MPDKRSPEIIIIGILAVIAVVSLAALIIIGPPTTVSTVTATAAVQNNPPTPTPTPRQTRNNGGPCDPNTPPPPPPARNAGINTDPTIPPKVQYTWTVSRSQFPEVAAHIEAAQAAGHPKYLTIDRAGNVNNARRNQAVNICPTLPGWERDEYPPAMFREGGQGASVRYTVPRDNGGAGGQMGKLLLPYLDGAIIEIRVVP